jgi:hypothetical protein
MLSMAEAVNGVLKAYEEAIAPLGVGSTWVGAVDGVETPTGHGAFISLASPVTAMQLGLTADAEVCRALANAMLGIESEDEPLPDQDVDDALGEIVNVMAGRFKVIGGLSSNDLSLGLPLIVHGRIEPSRHCQTVWRQVGVGSHCLHVSVILHADRHGLALAS